MEEELLATIRKEIVEAFALYAVYLGSQGTLQEASGAVGKKIEEARRGLATVEAEGRESLKAAQADVDAAKLALDEAQDALKAKYGTALNLFATTGGGQTRL